MTKKTKSATRKILYIAAEIVNKVIPFLALPIFASYLSKEEFGIVSNFNIFFFIISIFVGLSSESYLTSKFFTVEPTERGKIIGQLLTVAIGSMLVMIPLIFLFNNYLESVFSLSLTFSLYCVLAAFSNFIIRLFLIYVRFSEKHNLFFITQFAMIALNIGTSVLTVIYFDDKLNARIVSFTFSYVLIGIISFIALKNVINYKLNKILLRNIITFGIPLIPYQLTKWARNGFDRIIIVNLLGIGANGIYSYNFQIANVPSYIGNGLNLELTPKLFKELGKNKNDKPLKMIYQYWLLILLAFLIFIGVIFLFKKYVFVNDFKFEFFHFFLILFGSLFHSFSLLLNNFFFYWEKNYILTKITVISSIVGVLLNYLLTIKWGLFGTCFTFFLSEMIIFLFLYIYVRNQLHAKININNN
jgi:O-antigen/teichoic acid export membrane protein